MWAFAMRNHFVGAKGDVDVWLSSGFVPRLTYLFKRRLEQGSEDQWILVDGYLEDEDREGRRLFAFFSGLGCVANDLADLLKVRKRIDVGHADYYYAFHGENPWSPQWWRNYEAEDGAAPALRQGERVVEVPGRGNPIRVISFTARMCWESYHSLENQNGFGVLLDPAFAIECGLGVVPHRWMYVDAESRLAAVSCENGIKGHRANLTYVRLDVLRKFLAERGMEFVISCWGERDLAFDMEKRETLYAGINFENLKFSKVHHLKL